RASLRPRSTGTCGCRTPSATPAWRTCYCACTPSPTDPPIIPTPEEGHSAMSKLVPAYSSSTGKKLPYLVHEHAFSNPVYRGKIRCRPTSTANEKNTTKTPAAGDKKE